MLPGEIQNILALLPEPAATAFAVAAFMACATAKSQGLLWENYRDGEIFVSHSGIRGHISGSRYLGEVNSVRTGCWQRR